MKKLSTVVLALLAALMVLGFVGCKQEPDEPAGPSVVTTWEYTEGDETFTASFYNDGTWSLVDSLEGITMDMMKGTYSGDSTKDGTLTGELTYVNDAMRNLDIKVGNPVQAVISGDTIDLIVDSMSLLKLTKKR